MCKCIEDVEKALQEKYGDDQAGLDCVYCLDTVGGELSRYPRLQAEVRGKKKNGEFGKARMIVVRFGFCPFCGKPYREPDHANLP